MKIKSGDSQDKSREKNTAIRLVPTSAPSMTANADGKDMSPWPTNDETISAVAVLDWTNAVTPIPDIAAVARLVTLLASMLRKLAPKTLRMPVRTRCVPQTSRAIAANRFSKCVKNIFGND
jgi:hypothetical protein